MLLISSDFILTCLSFCLLVLCRCIDSSEVRVAVYTFVVHVVNQTRAIVNWTPLHRLSLSIETVTLTTEHRQRALHIVTHFHMAGK